MAAVWMMVAALLWLQPATAGTLTCDQFAEALTTTARGGETLVLDPGQSCGTVDVTGKQWSPPVTVMAHGSSVDGLRLRSSSGLRWYGGTITAPGGFTGDREPNTTTIIDKSQAISLVGVEFTGGKGGVMIRQGSADIEIVAGLFRDLRAEGVQTVGGALGLRDIRIIGNQFRDFHPIPNRCYLPGGGDQIGAVRESESKAACDLLGGKWINGDHPDGHQMWQANIVGLHIEGNSFVGNMQGAGNQGGTPGGWRGKIINNYFKVATSWCIRAYQGVLITLRGNICERTDGSTRRPMIGHGDATPGTGPGEGICGNTNAFTWPGLTHPTPHKTIVPCRR